MRQGTTAMKVDLGQVIAERRLRDEDQPEREVWVRVGLPCVSPEGPHGDYVCPYQISGAGDEKVRYAVGVDSLQALELALLVLPSELVALLRQCPSLRWEDAPAGSFAFTPTLMSYPPKRSKGGEE